MGTVKRMALAALTSLVVCVPRSHADKVELTPFLKLNTEYDDNIHFSQTDRKDDFITTLSPGIRMKRTTERLSLYGTGELGYRYYQDETDLNAFAQDLQGGVEYSVSPLLRLNADASFRRDATTDRDIGTTGLVMGTASRDQINLGTGGSYVLDEKTSLAGQYSLTRESFNDPEFFDSNAHNIQLSLSRNLEPSWLRTVGRLQAGYGRYNFIGSQTQNYSLTAGFKRQVSELLSLAVDLGGRYSYTKTWGLHFVSDTTPPIIIDRRVSPEVSDNAMGGVGTATVAYQGEKDNWDLSFTRGLQPASGMSGTTERTRLFLGFTRRFTEELRGRMESDFFLNTRQGKEGYANAIDTDTFELRPRLIYQISPDFMLSAAYRYTYYQDNEAGLDVDKNYFSLQLDYQYPLFD